MNLETAIAALLKSVAPTTPFASADPAVRPRITYQTISGNYNENLGGEGPYRGQRQIDVWSLSYAEAHGLADQAKVALRNGLMVGSITDNPDDYETDTKLHRVSFDVAAWLTNAPDAGQGGGEGAVLPPGGDTGDVLTKNTTTDGDVAWKAAAISYNSTNW